MKTLVVAQQKGGVGKTATIVHLAFDFLERGLRVAVIDLDTQGNASGTLEAHTVAITASQLFQAVPADRWATAGADISEGPCIALIRADPDLADVSAFSADEASAMFIANLDAIAKLGFDVCLIDTAPGLGVALVSSLYATNFVLSPIELERYSIDGIEGMLLVIKNVRKTHKLKFLGMVPSKVDGRNARHGRHLLELQEAYPGAILPSSIGLRSSISDALAEGVPVWQIKRTAARKAASEVRALAQYVFEKMEIA